MKKVRLRTDARCPKCGGNLFINNDYHGWYEQCLQCSHTTYLKAIYEGGRKAVTAKK
jgi:ssDNA-binding Zn-finger/Zn-ribbon topoisomerase 1